MSDRWTEQLSDYLDGDMAASECQALEAHLAECRECAAALDDLRLVVERARALPATPPAQDLWPAIAERIAETPLERPEPAPEPRRARPAGPSWGARRFSFSLPQLVAAAAALVVVTGGTVWTVRTVLAPNDPGTVASRPSEPTGQAASAGDVVYASADYDAKIAEIERAVEQRRDELDPATVAVIEDHLRTIREATRQAQRALAADPSNAFLRNYLEEEMLRRLELLEKAAVTASAPE
jgi:anti-sigma factor RsiW